MTNGLGNQLFILAYAHHFSRDKKVTLRVNVKPKKNREFLLADFLMNSCIHNIEIRPASGFFFSLFRRIPIRLVGTSWFPKQYIAKFLKQMRIVLEPEVFAFEDYLLNVSEKCVEVRGAFIHRKYVDASWDQFGKELFNFLLTITPKIDVGEPQVVMHIRRGDSVIESELGRRTLLTREYYEKSLKFISGEYNLKNPKILICTDSKDEVSSMFEGTNLQIIGPGDASALETLKIMTTAKYLVCANSTLSWWAGRLAIETGAVVIIPEPWDRTSNWPIGGDLSIDGAIKLAHECV